MAHHYLCLIIGRSRLTLSKIGSRKYILDHRHDGDSILCRVQLLSRVSTLRYGSHTTASAGAS